MFEFRTEISLSIFFRVNSEFSSIHFRKSNSSRSAIAFFVLIVTVLYQLQVVFAMCWLYGIYKVSNQLLTSVKPKISWFFVFTLFPFHIFHSNGNNRKRRHLCCHIWGSCSWNLHILMYQWMLPKRIMNFDMFPIYQIVLSYNLVIFGALLMYYVVFIGSFFVDYNLSRYLGTNDSRWAWVILIFLLPATGQMGIFSWFIVLVVWRKYCSNWCFILPNVTLFFQFLSDFWLVPFWPIVIAWHFTSVMYSLYQKIRKDHRLHPSVLYAPTTAPEDPITITT